MLVGLLPEPVVRGRGRVGVVPDGFDLQLQGDDEDDGKEDKAGSCFKSHVADVFG